MRIKYMAKYDLFVYENGDVTRFDLGTKKSHKYKHQICRNGYHRIQPMKNGAKNCHSIHRLVAKAFIPNPHNHPEVNHIDSNKSNNTISNLEWCTRKHNQNHLINSGRWSQRIRFFQCEDRNKQIFIDLGNGMDRKQVETKYGISKMCLVMIIKTHGQKASKCSL